MARIFSISFVYNDTSYSTMVTVRTTPFYIEYTLSNLSADLLRLLPGNKIISPSHRQFLFPNAKAENSAALMTVLIKAVEEHLQAVTGNHGFS